MRWSLHIPSVLLGCIAATASAVPNQQFAARQSADILASYDYVVVGSGPGGGAVGVQLATVGL
ncbi:hypothetical protein CH063_14359, partial [Colletotrichum higginsianum]